MIACLPHSGRCACLHACARAPSQACVAELRGRRAPVSRLALLREDRGGLLVIADEAGAAAPAPASAARALVPASSARAV